MTKAPAWVVKAPFDVAKFFELPPPSQNAAPLYLDALFEFGDEMAVCFPTDQRGRAATAKAHADRIDQAYSAWEKDRSPSHLNWAEIDALAVVMRTGLRKLDLAQVRPRCVFAEGLAYDSPIPQSQVSRRPVRLWALLTVRALDRGDLDTAIGNIQRILRLSRDLRPRGAGIDQIAGAAFDAIACNILIPAVLEQPKLQANHCDRLLALLKEHRARTVDSFAAGVQATYLMERVILRTFEHNLALTTDANGRAVEKRLDRDGMLLYFLKLVEVVFQSADPSKHIDPRNLTNPQFMAKARAQLDQVKPDFPQERQALDDWAKTLLSLQKAPYSERVRKAEEVMQRYKPPEGRPFAGGALVFTLTILDYRPLLTVSVNDPVYIGAAECLLALRRWELIGKGKPSSLAEVCRSAGLERVPVDAYSGSPLRMILVSGQPVIYSVGPDGDDDRGLKDADLGRNPDGDFLFRLPKPARPTPR